MFFVNDEPNGPALIAALPRLPRAVDGSNIPILRNYPDFGLLVARHHFHAKPHPFQVAVHCLLQLDYPAYLLRQRGFITFGQFLHSLGEGLADAVHLAVDGGIEGGQPFIFHYQRLDFLLGKFGIFIKASASSASSHSLSRCLSSACSLLELQPGFEHLGFLFGFFVAFDLLKAGGDVGLVHFVQFGEGTFLAAVFFFHLSDLER